MFTPRTLPLNSAYKAMVDAADELSWEHGTLYYIYNNNVFTAVVSSEKERDAHIKETPTCAVYEADLRNEKSERIY